MAKIKKDMEKVPTSEKGLSEGYMRKSYTVEKKVAEKIDAIAFWDRRQLKEVMQSAMSSYINAWEKKNGAVKIPGDSSK